MTLPTTKQSIEHAIRQVPGPRMDSAFRWNVYLSLCATQEEFVVGVQTELLRNLMSIVEVPSWRLLSTTSQGEPPRQPFRPRREERVAGTTTRSMQPGDLTPDELDSIRVLISESKNALLNGFALDILWVVTGDHVCAQRAIDARVEAATLIEPSSGRGEIGFQLGRALQLALKLGDMARVQLAMNSAMAILETLAKAGDVHAFAHLMNVLGEPWARQLRVDSDSVASVTAALLVGAGVEWAEGDLHEFDLSLAIAQGFANATRAVQLPRGLLHRRLELMKELATTGGVFHAMHWYREALQAASLLGLDQEVSELKVRIREATTDAERNMARLESSYVISEEELAPWRDRISSAESTSAAIRDVVANGGLLELGNAPYVERSTTTLRDLMPTTQIRDGKLMSRTANSDASWSHESNKTKAAIALAMLQERGLAPNDFFACLDGSRWLSEAHAPFMGRSAEALVAGDPLSAISVLLPRYEAMLREALIAARKPTTRRKSSDGTERDVLLHDLLGEPWLTETLGEEHVAFVRHFLADPTDGRNLRNELAHGTLKPDECDAGTAALVWFLVIRLVESCRLALAPASSPTT